MPDYYIYNRFFFSSLLTIVGCMFYGCINIYMFHLSNQFNSTSCHIFVFPLTSLVINKGRHCTMWSYMHIVHTLFKGKLFSESHHWLQGQVNTYASRINIYPHPLYETVSSLSSFYNDRLLHPMYPKERYQRSLLPSCSLLLLSVNIYTISLIIQYTVVTISKI